MQQVLAVSYGRHLESILVHSSQSCLAQVCGAALLKLLPSKRTLCKTQISLVLSGKSWLLLLATEETFLQDTSCSRDSLNSRTPMLHIGLSIRNLQCLWCLG